MTRLVRCNWGCWWRRRTSRADLAGLFQGTRKGLHTAKALLVVFGQCCHYHLLNFRRDRGYLPSQGWWRSRQVLRNYFPGHTAKGSLTAEPFIGHDPQGILIAGRARLALELLRCHVGQSPTRSLCIERARTMRKGADAKVTEPHLVVWPQQDVLRLDIPMDQPLVVGMLQGGCNRRHIAHHGRQWQLCSL